MDINGCSLYHSRISTLLIFVIHTQLATFCLRVYDGNLIIFHFVLILFLCKTCRRKRLDVTIVCIIPSHHHNTVCVRWPIATQRVVILLNSKSFYCITELGLLEHTNQCLREGALHEFEIILFQHIWPQIQVFVIIDVLPATATMKSHCKTMATQHQTAEENRWYLFWGIWRCKSNKYLQSLQHSRSSLSLLELLGQWDFDKTHTRIVTLVIKLWLNKQGFEWMNKGINCDAKSSVSSSS